MVYEVAFSKYENGRKFVFTQGQFYLIVPKNLYLFPWFMMFYGMAYLRYGRYDTCPCATSRRWQSAARTRIEKIGFFSVFQYVVMCGISRVIRTRIVR